MSMTGKLVGVTLGVMALTLSTGEPDSEQKAEDTGVFVVGTALNTLQAGANAVGRVASGETAPAPEQRAPAPTEPVAAEPR